MIKFSFQEKSYQTGRIVGDVGGRQSGPTVVFVGGIHGNEPSGVIALQKVFEELERFQIPLRGRFIGLAGNLSGLGQNRRFISQDLNRMWNHDFTRGYHSTDSTAELNAEQKEQRELFNLIQPLLNQVSRLFFIDLHTTSAPSVPFIVINDQLDNRHFALQFPIPTVLGIEEYLRGPLLSYLNDFGPIALGFEAGQHTDPESVKVHVAFIYQALAAAGAISSDQVPQWREHQLRLQNCGRDYQGIYEVIFRKPTSETDAFQMNPGYRNFMPIRPGEILAQDLQGDIVAPKGGRIFMPLYQNTGEDGFFIVRPVPRWALRLSSLLRKINCERLLTLLPGVTRSKTQSDALVVNRRIYRFLATELFHLLGYRRKKVDDHEMVFSRREIRS